VLEHEAEPVRMALREVDVRTAHDPQTLAWIRVRIARVLEECVHRICGAFVDCCEQVVLVGEQQIQIADGVADGLGHLAHREAGDPFTDDEQLGGGQGHLALLFLGVFVSASHRIV
jgi:hypothetical protein